MCGSQIGLRADAGASKNALNEQNKANLDAAEALVNSRLNPFSVDSVDKAVGIFVSVCLAAIPTLVGYSSGETTILDPTHPTADKTADIMNMLNSFIGGVFITVVLLHTALQDTGRLKDVVASLVQTIALDHDGNVSRDKVGSKMALELRTVEAVESFIALHTCIYSFSHYRGNFHVRSFMKLLVAR